MKSFILFLILFLISGCSVDYNLNIESDNSLSEEIIIYSENNEESQLLYEDPWPIKAFYSDLDSGDYPEELDGVSYYVNEVFLDQGLYHKKLSNVFQVNKFEDANSIRSCYQHFYVNEYNSSVSLSTSSEFLCMEDYLNLTEVNIRIRLQNPAISSNADIISDNVYMWKITRENYKNHGIILTYQKENDSSQDISDSESEEKDTRFFLVLLILGFFFLFLIGVFIYNYQKRNNN